MLNDTELDRMENESQDITDELTTILNKRINERQEKTIYRRTLALNIAENVLCNVIKTLQIRDKIPALNLISHITDNIIRKVDACEIPKEQLRNG